MTQRRQLTSSERHGVIALAVVMLIIVIIMAVDRGTFNQTVTATPETAILQPDTSTYPLTDTISNTYHKDSINTTSRHKKSRKRKTTDKDSKKLPAGRQRNYLEESAE